MTATVFSDPWQVPQTQCRCPNCGDYHATADTFTIPGYYGAEYGLPAIRRREPRKASDLRKSLEHYEAIGESRELARGRLPAPVVHQRVAVARDPRRVHLLRCMTRRPRLSLLERVRGMR